MKRILFYRPLLPVLVTVLPCAVSAQQMSPAALAGTRLDIVATGEMIAVPDIVQIGAGVVAQASTATAALAENARRTAAIMAVLRKAGLADRDIQTTAISLSPQYRYGDNQPPVITGYQASNRVGIRFHDIRKAGGILDALVGAGANQIDGPSFAIERPEPLLDAAREKAVATAQARAALYARAAGLHVKRILAINENGDVPSPVVPMAMLAKARMNADTSIEAGDQKVSVSVAVTFELQ